MTGWSTSYRWAGRTRDGVDRVKGKGRDKRPPTKDMLRHALRSIEEEEHSHSNEKIDSNRTADNVVLVPDGAGRLRLAGGGDSVESVHDTVVTTRAAARHVRKQTDKKTGEVKEVPVAVRADATECVEVILQLDPEYTGKIVDMTDAQKADAREKLHTMVREVERHVGSNNTVAVAEHWDEDHPHIHMFFTPMTWDHQLIGSRIMGTEKGGYVARHDEMRTALRAVGYEATFERVDNARGNESPAKYKARRDRERREAAKDVERDQRDATQEAREAQLTTNQAAVNNARNELGELSETLVARADELDTRAADMDARSQTQVRRDLDLDEREAQVIKKSSEVRRQEAELVPRRRRVVAREQKVADRETEVAQRESDTTTVAEKQAETTRRHQRERAALKAREEQVADRETEVDGRAKKWDALYREAYENHTTSGALDKASREMFRTAADIAKALPTAQRERFYQQAGETVKGTKAEREFRALERKKLTEKMNSGKQRRDQLALDLATRSEQKEKGKDTGRGLGE